MCPLTYSKSEYEIGRKVCGKSFLLDCVPILESGVNASNAVEFRQSPSAGWQANIFTACTLYLPIFALWHSHFAKDGLATQHWYFLWQRNRPMKPDSVELCSLLTQQGIQCKYTDLGLDTGQSGHLKYWLKNLQMLDTLNPVFAKLCHSIFQMPGIRLCTIFTILRYCLYTFYSLFVHYWPCTLYSVQYCTDLCMTMYFWMNFPLKMIISSSPLLR